MKPTSILRSVALVVTAAALSQAQPAPSAQPSPAPTPAPAPAVSVPLAPDSGPSAQEIAQRVQAFYDQTRVYRAEFAQRFWIKSQDKFKHSSGQVVFERPGRMSWRYTSNGNRVVSDGTTVRVYDAESQQLYTHPIGESQYPAALAFLTGEGRLLDAFQVRKLDAAALHFEGGYVLEGVPVTPTAAYDRVLFYIDGATAQVRRVLLLDAQGNRNRITFTNPEVNVTVSPDEFAFVAPAGTQDVRP